MTGPASQIGRNADRCTSVGLIGVGSLGGAIGARLMEKRFRVAAWNRSPEKLSALASAGAIISPSAASVFCEAQTVFVCLSDAEATCAALLAPSVTTKLRRPSLVVNTSTIGASASSMLSQEFRHLGIEYLEMPVSGGPEGAANGTLAAYLAPIPPGHNQIEEMVRAIASTVIRCSSNERAQQVKVLNNLCEAINLWGSAEAIALGLRHGISLAELHCGLTGGRGDSRYLRVLLERLRNRPPNVAVSMAIRTKDLGLAKEFAKELPPLSALTKTLFDATAAELGMAADQCDCFEKVSMAGHEFAEKYAHASR